METRLVEARQVAGPLMDAQIADRVTKFIHFPPCQKKVGDDCACPLPSYSTSIEAAWGILEYLAAQRPSVMLWLMVSPLLTYKVEAYVEIQSAVTKAYVHKQLEPVYADTAPLAICLMALQWANAAAEVRAWSQTA